MKSISQLASLVIQNIYRLPVKIRVLPSLDALSGSSRPGWTAMEDTVITHNIEVK